MTYPVLPKIPATLNDLTDVTNSAPGVGEVLVYGGSPGIFSNKLLLESDISDLQNYALSTHNHSGVYELVFTKNTGFNLDLGTIAGTVSEGDHTHVMVDITDSAWILDITTEPIGDLSDVTNTAPVDKHVLIYDGVTDNKYENRFLLEADISDFGTYLTTEINDLSSSVIWVNVPDSNITQTSVTQHETTLSIAASQITGETWISDITAEPLSDLGDVTITSNSTGELLKWTGSAWINNTLTEAGIAASDHNHDSDYAAKEATINTQTGTAYTLVLTDADTKIVEMDNAGANTLTVPLNSSVAFPIGTKIDVVQYGAGETTIAVPAGSPTVIIQTAETLVLDGQYSGATLYKRGTDEWVLIGRLVAA